MPVSDILAALADENRRRILSKLKEGRIASGALAQAVGMTPQALSYHLKRLREAELIYETRHKNFIYYELDLTVLDEAILWLNELRGGANHEAEETIHRRSSASGTGTGAGAGGPALPSGPHPGPL
ncbi:MAG: winged helix-turn-helix transcriptional regulator [Oscillospiraceae bacterium]|jgi:DNA-binding transcriptional ArsR family regulator|nr:winged helix-turn-helix transcriptional regulator [Oscillospiraceae bacterium]